ncbi:ABC transporter ATP-binding protein/permease [Gleimia europaea]|uniref:ABC transporter domain-containing protein n=1 Tax=Gleimia europaea ACS-120-V-Col10b TaxID=883069 RepID=A0A9W5VVM9_9ACTO|nr:ABC transporter ATP-binding protein/permease [Gleimia europaea]EPD29418.1 hypothetical protein HMPREF9238_01619 [Gleimia europaea ACS-120-V-Col10b]
MGQLVLKQVDHTYAGDYPVYALKGIDLTIDQGEYVALIGPSGSGKSTLLNILGLLGKQTGGSYLIDGVETGTLSETEMAILRAKTFGIIFQSFHLMDKRSAIENVAVGTLYQGLDEHDRENLAEDALKFADLEQSMMQQVSTLSGGQRQRVAIARAITTGAPVILADEPTGNLDSASGKTVIETLENLNRRGATLIVVTHDASMAERADRIIALKDGQIISDTQRSDSVESPEGYRDPAPAPMLRRKYSHVRRKDMVKDVFSGLFAHFARTISLISAVGLAVVFTLSTIGIATSAKYQVSELFDATLNRRVAVVASPSQSDAAADAILEAAREPTSLERVRAVAGVENATVFIHHGDVEVSPRPGREESTQLVSIVDPTTITDQLETNEYNAEKPLSNEEVLVGITAAKKMGLGPISAHPVITIDGVPYTAVGIIDSAGLLGDLLDSAVITSEASASHASPVWINLELRTKPGAAAQVAGQAPIAWVPIAADSLSVNAPPDPKDLRASVESSVTAILLTLTVVSVAAAVIALTAAMTGTVRQRTHEFGLRRTIGARRKHISSIILLEALIVSAIGGLIGTALAMLTILGVTIARGWQPIIDPIMIPGGIALAIIVGATGSLTGAWKASRITPAEALRH